MVLKKMKKSICWACKKLLDCKEETDDKKQCEEYEEI